MLKLAAARNIEEDRNESCSTLAASIDLTIQNKYNAENLFDI